MEETTLCLGCGLKAIKEPGAVLTSYPPIYTFFWKCKCGWKAEAPSIRGKTQQEDFNERWDKAQK